MSQLIDELDEVAARLQAGSSGNPFGEELSAVANGKASTDGIALLRRAYDELPSYLGDAGRKALLDGQAQGEGAEHVATRLRGASAALSAIRRTGEPDQRRRHYSERQGRGPRTAPVTDRDIAEFLADLIGEFGDDAMQELFGKDCVDDPISTANVDATAARLILRDTGHRDVWPFREHLDELTQDTCFDLIEWLCDHVSDGVQGSWHDWNGCGNHFSTFDPVSARARFVATVNQFLARSSEALEMSFDGCIKQRPDAGFAPAMDASFPESTDDEYIVRRVEAAKTRFLAREASTEDIRSAVRELAGVLEHLRPLIKESMLKADEGMLFRLANEFDVRHHDTKQHRDYDHPTWLRWMFYVYLATIHALTRVQARQSRAARFWRRGDARIKTDDE